jgi:bleomycin hydrolase
MIHSIKSISFFVLLLAAATLSAQNTTGDRYEFRDEKVMKATPVKNQENTGTCWAFSTASFLESEVLRVGKGEVNFSEMYVVRHIYRQKCDNYVRRQGTAQLSQGGLAHDLINAVRTYGIVPEQIYPGRKDLLKPFDHTELEKKLQKTCSNLVELGKKGELPPNWIAQIDAILDDTFGPLPGKFTLEGRPHTANTYWESFGLNLDHYVTITSFTHHPMYKQFVLEVPDNFSNGMMYNVPLDDMMRSINYGLQQGFTACWDADVSNPGFAAKYGIAIVPTTEWKAKTDAQRDATFKYLEPQKVVTQEQRQELFDRQETMDDHLMHLTGLRAEAHTADIYYAVKNSWGEISDLKGYLNVSEAYMRLNTISFLMHRDALPLDLRQRLGLAPGDPVIPNSGSTTPSNQPKQKGAKPQEQSMQVSPNKTTTTPIPPKKGTRKN